MAIKKTETTPLLALNKVTIRCGRQRVFERTTWIVVPGQMWALIGPNGAGKSLLIDAIRGRLPVVEGDIEYGFPDTCLPEEEIVHLSFESQKRLSRKAGSFHQARWHSLADDSGLSVRRTLSKTRCAGPRRAGDFEQRRDEAIRLLGIQNLLGREVMQLSNGELRKVLIAQALIQSPSLLFLDDPFCGLDQRSRRNLMNILKRLIRKLPVILVTPRRAEIPDEATHLLYIDHQSVVAQGEKASLLKDPRLHEFLHPPPGPERAKITAGPSNGPPLIRMRKVNVIYNRVRVLKELDWIVREGQRWALLGPNGAGKSTLLSLITADNPQAYGNDITLFGRPRGSGESIWEIKRRIGHLSPELHLHMPPGLTGLDVVCSGLVDPEEPEAVDPKQIRRAGLSWMKQLKLAGWADESFGALSCGEQRLILIARALVNRPGLIVLDEPCQGLDPANRNRTLRLVDEAIGKTGAGLIYVTHHPDELPGCITHLLKLRQGRVVKKGVFRG
ncbi:MAG: ATP-binding cassette domain-containing protein [Verrucomicrobiota bacterium]